MPRKEVVRPKWVEWSRKLHQAKREFLEELADSPDADIACTAYVVLDTYKNGGDVEAAERLMVKLNIW